MINVISGGLHASHNLDFQDFMIMPVGAASYSQALEMSLEVHWAVHDLLLERGLSTLKADEGGFGPALPDNRAALDLLMAAVERAGYRPGDEIAFALDVAATHFYRPEQGRYDLASEGRMCDASELIDLLAGWVADYPIVSIEDGLAEDDWAGWRELTDRLGGAVQLVGDDLFTTNPQRVRQGIDQGVANAVLVKMNQIGTLTETLEVIRLAQKQATAQSSRRDPAKPRTAPSPTLPSPRAPGRSRSARSRNRSGWPNTISCCVSRRRWAPRRSSPGGGICRRQVVGPPATRSANTSVCRGLPD